MNFLLVNQRLLLLFTTTCPNYFKEKLNELDIPEYLLYAEKMLKDEEQRANSYLEPGTLHPLVTACQTNFIGIDVQPFYVVFSTVFLGNNMKTIASRGLSDMMANDRKEDLSRLYW